MVLAAVVSLFANTKVIIFNITKTAPIRVVLLIIIFFFKKIKARRTNRLEKMLLPEAVAIEPQGMSLINKPPSENAVADITMYKTPLSLFSIIQILAQLMITNTALQNYCLKISYNKGMKKHKGFTLAEMLIVVAIVGVLISIMAVGISGIFERARETADLTNFKNAISELNAAYISPENIDKTKIAKITSNNRLRICIKCQSKKTGWQSKGLEKSGSGVLLSNAVCYAPDSEKPYMCIYIDMSTGQISFNREVSAKEPLYN